MEKANIYTDLDTWQQRCKTDSGAVFFFLAAVINYNKPDSLNQHNLSSYSSVSQNFNTNLLGIKLSRVAFLDGEYGTFHELTFPSF